MDNLYNEIEFIDQAEAQRLVAQHDQEVQDYIRDNVPSNFVREITEQNKEDRKNPLRSDALPTFTNPTREAVVNAFPNLPQDNIDSDLAIFRGADSISGARFLRSELAEIEKAANANGFFFDMPADLYK